MKKLLSILLVFAMILSICAVSAVSAGAQTTDVEIVRNKKSDIAPTGGWEYYYSSEPYADIHLSEEEGYVLGYIGDSDEDGEITVLDASLIQLHLANRLSLNDNATELADVDFDWEVSVIDAATIQCWIAKKSDNEFISHTLYMINTLYLAHDQIASFLMENGEYYVDEEGCEYYSYYVYDEDGVLTFECDYSPTYECIDFLVSSFNDSGDTYYYTGMETYRGQYTFDFYSGADYFDAKDNVTELYFAYGWAELTEITEDNEYKFFTNCTMFDSSDGLVFEDVEDLVKDSLAMCIESGDYYLWDYIDCFVTDLLI